MQNDVLINTDLLGFLAGTFTTIAFLPQVLKTWNTKSANDVSLVMFMLFIFGVLLWCIYGWEIHSKPVIIANIITFILASMIIILKLIFENIVKNPKENLEN